MRVAVFTSGYLRTFRYQFESNFDIIRRDLGNCEIDLFYSFWSKNHRSDRINDDWHSKIPDTCFDNVDKKKIDEYLIDSSVTHFEGEIEDYNLSESIIRSSSFPEEKKRLASQYYKVNRVATEFFNPGYDLYVTLRPDVLLNKFISREEALNIGKSIIVNENYWYNAKFNGTECNEYIWISTEENFLESNSQYCNLEKIRQQIPHIHGEAITGQHFKNIGKDIKTFNFDYRVFR
tara:strand:- start:826 stop:1527 length:702 start_codon:yes stop_codon:yes gene_type:complete